MVTKKKTAAEETRQGRVKVSKLQLNKETVTDLSGDETNRIKGGGDTRECGDVGDLLKPQPINRPGYSNAGDPLCD